MSKLSQAPPTGDVLDAFAEQHEPLTATEVAERAGYEASAVHDTLQDLADRGVVQSRRINGLVRVWWRRPSETPSGSGVDTEHLASVESPADDTRQLEAHMPTADLLQANPISTAVFDSSGSVTFANERAETLLGLERDEDGKQRYTAPKWSFYREDGTPIPPAEHPVARVFETGEPSFGFEHGVALPDGTERWVWGNATPVAGPDGSVDHVVVGFADVTPLKEREEKLTSDRRRRLELSSSQLFSPFLDAAEGSFRIAVDEVVPLPDETALEYLSAEGMTAKALTDVLQHSDAVRNVRLLSSTGDSCSLELRVTSPTVPVLFEEFGGTVRTLVEYSDGAPTLVGELPGDVDPREIIQAVREVYPDAKLGTQELRYTPRLLSDIVRETLTERKFAVLQTAYYGGYFETPRRSSGDDLAEQLGITRQTFNQHLRKAEHLVFEQLFEASAEGKH